MSEQNLTAGASRALQEIRNLDCPSDEVRYWKLLEGFLDSEGKATEILRLFQVTTVQGALEQTSAPLTEYPVWRRGIIRRADQIAAATAGNVPTGTEHLLLAALELSEPVENLLQTFGLTRERLLDEISEELPELEVPAHALVQLPAAQQGKIEDASLYRILDASANRAREGLRTVEDYVRFRLNDALLSGELKAIRHQMTESLNHLGQAGWVSFRDTLHDVGTQSDLASERQRGSVIDVLRANLKRTEEALRSLEEYSKLLDTALSLKLSDCRYRMYTVEKVLETSIQNRHRLQDCQLYLLVTADTCRYGAEETIRHSLEKGVDIVQLREKSMPTRDYVAYARKVREMTEHAGKLLIINDRVDIAAAIGADGVHLGQDDLDVASARQLLGGSKLIGVSTHSPQQARQAVFDGVDYLGVGPTFPSSTKTFTEFPGLPYVEYVAENVCIPWFAIGGIDVDNVSEVIAAGGTRVAVSSVVCRSPHPRGVVSQFKEKLSRAPFQVQARPEPAP